MIVPDNIISKSRYLKETKTLNKFMEQEDVFVYLGSIFARDGNIGKYLRQII